MPKINDPALMRQPGSGPSHVTTPGVLTSVHDQKIEASYTCAETGRAQDAIFHENPDGSFRTIISSDPWIEHILSLNPSKAEIKSAAETDGHLSLVRQVTRGIHVLDTPEVYAVLAAFPDAADLQCRLLRHAMATLPRNSPYYMTYELNTAETRETLRKRVAHVLHFRDIPLSRVACPEPHPADVLDAGQVCLHFYLDPTLYIEGRFPDADGGWTLGEPIRVYTKKGLDDA